MPDTGKNTQAAEMVFAVGWNPNLIWAEFMFVDEKQPLVLESKENGKDILYQEPMILRMIARMNFMWTQELNEFLHHILIGETAWIPQMWNTIVLC